MTFTNICRENSCLVKFENREKVTGTLRDYSRTFITHFYSITIASVDSNQQHWYSKIDVDR